jgi:biotin carboxyl carrier protein
MILRTIFPSYSILILGILSILTGCGTTEEHPEKKEETRTPVTFTTVNLETMSDTIGLNAVSGYLRKNVLKASATGLIETMNINLGDKVEKGEIIFTLKTKEAMAYDKTTSTDSTLTFNGEINIKASKSGVISSIAHQKGDYVQEGDELAILSEQNSLVFFLEVPFELSEFIKINGNYTIQLSDHRIIRGIIERKLPVMDIQSQTENFVVQPGITENLPENLVAKIFITTNKKKQSLVLPKATVLANETLTEFWVMKLINDSIAVKIPVKKGMENDSQIEILSPVLSKTDRILSSGNYGLPDTAKVTLKEN